MEKPPADWYPDPDNTGRLRYWDGQRWTSSLMDAPRPAVRPPFPSMWLFLLQLALLLAAVAVSVTGGFLIQEVDPMPVDPDGGCFGVDPTAQAELIEKVVIGAWLGFYLVSAMWTMRVCLVGRMRRRWLLVLMCALAALAFAGSGSVVFLALAWLREPLLILWAWIPAFGFGLIGVAAAILTRIFVGDRAGDFLTSRQLHAFTAVFVAQAAGALVLACWGPAAGLAMNISAC